MTAHRHRWTAPDRPDVLECADCGAICTWDLTDRSTHPDARLDREAPPERKPVAGWIELAGNYFLRAGEVFARANGGGGHWFLYRGKFTPEAWRRVAFDVIRSSRAEGLTAAQLAAEDALIAVRDEISRAVGR